MVIVLGVTGGIAAYKSVQIARLLTEAGHELHVVPTEDALRFVGAPTWEAISRNPVRTSVHDDVPEVRHVALGQRADLVIVAPATANTIARIVAGIADDLLGTTLLATQAPVVVAPAMHTEMWQNPATQHNIAVLRERGFTLVGPEAGRLTGADSGIGRMSEPETIARVALELLGPRDLADRRFLVTAGGTREPIDPVRFIGNRSSGRQGVAVAVAAAERGAEVVLAAANIELAVLRAAAEHPRISVQQVSSTGELAAVCEAEAPAADVVVMAAAVADYRVAEVADGKMRKEDQGSEGLSLPLAENPDILRGLVDGRQPDQLFVGFAAETVQSIDELHERGRRKRERKGVDLLAVNAVGWHEGFEREYNTLHVIDDGGEVAATATGSKREVADALLNVIAQRAAATHTSER